MARHLRAGSAAPAHTGLEAWASRLVGVDEIDLRRTSNKSKKDFESMLQRGASGRPDDPDVKNLDSYGHTIVLPEGENIRRQLGAFTITRGSVDGTSSKAVLGWAVPIGRTLFVLYLESARKFDIPGATRDQGQNAFAEALRALIRGARPREVHTPLLNRVFRLLDHALPVMRTLRTYGVRLYAEGRHLPLDSDDDKFMAAIRAAMADKDAAATVARLEGDRLTIYGRGEWYLGRNLLPFTWDTLHEVVQDPLTGDLLRQEVDRHVIVPTDRARELLQEFITLGGTPGIGRDQIAIALGRRGVLSRAPKYAGQFVTIDKLRRPRTAIDSLCAPEWVKAFRSGWYETKVELTSDLRDSYPHAPLEVDDEGRHWLTIRVAMPAPEEGWGISDEQWEKFEQQQFRQRNQARRGRARANIGRLRPLLGLCNYLEDDLQQTVLGFESSGYQLCQRPADLSTRPDGSPRAWGPEAIWVATVNSQRWHRSLADALLACAVAVADQVAPLTRERVPLAADSRRARIELAFADAEQAVSRIEKRIAGIRRERQEVRGDDSLDEQTRQTDIRQLRQEEREARAELDTARALVEQRRQALDSDDGEQPDAATSEEEADFSNLQLVIAALLRYPTTAPAGLARALTTLLGDSLQWRLTHQGTMVSWSATMKLPLRDGSHATHTVEGTVPTSTGSSRAHLSRAGSERQRHLPRRSAPDSSRVREGYARRFFLDGESVTQIAESRGVTQSGRCTDHVHRALRTWLRDKGVISDDLARAALDLPILATRQALYRALTNDGTAPASTFETYIADVYRRGIPAAEADGPRQTRWGLLWCAGPMLAERRIYQALKDQPTAGAAMAADTVADLADVPYSTSGPNRVVGRGISLIDITNGGRRRRAAGDNSPVLPPFLEKDWGPRDTRPASKKHLALRPCPHPHCTGHLMPVPVPEVAGMLLCDKCRRVPHNELVVFPRDYLRPWSGGRRRRTSDGTRVGTVLAPTPSMEQAILA